MSFIERKMNYYRKCFKHDLSKDGQYFVLQKLTDDHDKLSCMY